VDDLAPAEARLAWEHAQRMGWSPDAAERYCHRCGISAGRGAATSLGCSECINTQFHWQRVTRLSAYVDPVKHWIQAFKFSRQWYWAPYLAEAMAQRIDVSPDPANCAVVPVPMPTLRRWKRGFNQSHLLAQHIARVRKVTLADVLYRVKYAQPQTNLDTAASRLRNVKDNFGIADVDLTGWHVWLIDDVKTTGATANACARLLKQAGAASVHLAVIAVANPHRPEAVSALSGVDGAET
jgi:ComF family protein